MHHSPSLGTRAEKLGYHVRLIPAQFVKPYVKSNKNDKVDAEAICEAMSRPNMRFVALKKQLLSKIFKLLIAFGKNWWDNVLPKLIKFRGLVGEYGVISPVGIHQLRKALPKWLEDAENGLSELFRTLLNSLAEDLRYLDDRIKSLDENITENVQQKDPVAQSLDDVAWVGPLTASALSGALGDGRAFLKKDVTLQRL